jgi:hypothetical protein
MNQTLMIGYDRRLRIEWLDVIGAKQAAGVPLSELRAFGQALLKDRYHADEARRKTLTVLLHLWVNVPEEARALRDGAAKLLAEVESPQRVALHWGLALAMYPFFRDAADAAGRLLILQDQVSLAQLKRRLAERWGQRELVERALRHVVRSWVDWGVLRDSKQRGTYTATKSIDVSGPLAAWMVEAVLVGAGVRSQAVAQIRKAPQLFPFGIEVSAHELRRAVRLEMHREADAELVALRR